MMVKNKRYITNKKQRVVLSDVLPFETPATFSNRHFYEFLISNEVELVGNRIQWKNNDRSTKAIMKMLFGISDGQIQSQSCTHFDLNVNSGALKAIPFHYKISHKHKEFRELTVVHPKSQLAVIEFYDVFKDLILYYSSQSDFSLRRPFNTAQFTYFKDRLHYDKLSADHETEGVEVFDKEYENLKTFFSYKEISNIHKFYESYKYHRCEKKYDNLFKFDISKCFDSIYSHSITWALLEKEIVKDNIGLSKSTFGGIFDRLMQDLNYGETNGIIIGPEFSRIFAEIILQKIDKTVQLELADLESPLIFRKDYEVFRYVDDYFIFYTDEHVKDEVLNRFRLKLRDYKLGLNEGKSEEYSKPILTDITKAKVGVVKLLEKQLAFNKIEFSKDEFNGKKLKKPFYISSNRLITEFKIIVDTSKVKYKDIQNFTLGCIDNKTIELIKVSIEECQDENVIANEILEMLDLSFFIYTVTPRVNSTIKLCSIISKLAQFSKLHLSVDLKHRIFKKIYDEIFLVLKKVRIKEHIQIETLYLLIALDDLGREYRLSEELLGHYLRINLVKKECEYPLHYFSITVTLFYIGNKRRYKKIKKVIENYILQKINDVSMENRTKHTELVLLFFDLLSCPYLDRVFKNKLFLLFGIQSSQGALKSEIINYRKYWFTKWDNFNFGKELEAKKSQEVY
ncbi:antiviral reverse transcriptase Drt3b [Mariniflexile ostreae]|uniref:Antiviral reverse transcriptase Drt3b n=1 Tax=Mariniflexile ostreae TaxID=1520892 RepID=A0ABV5FAT3_9FLAO